jgi:hypothetical protein
VKLRATVLALALLAGATAPARADVPAPPAGYSLVWSDDFGGAAGSPLNGADWRYDTGTHYPCANCPAQWGTGEVESMTDSTDNVFQDGAGHLVIRALRDAQGGWTSGRVETQRSDFAAPDGGILRLQGSLQLPNLSGAAAQGYWPAFWALGSGFRPDFAGWPGIGELDVMENVDGQNTDYGTLHCGVSPGGPCHEFNGLGGTTPGGDPSLQAGFHTYAIELDRSTSPQQLRWYLDGRRFFSIDSTQVDAQTWENATHHGFFMILDLAMGGGFPGNPTADTASGGAMVVDYVAAYTAQPADTTPVGTVPPTLSLTVTPGTGFGTFTPGVDQDYHATATADVLSTADSAQLSVSDPDTVAPGHLVNGAFSLPSPLLAAATSPGGTGSAPVAVGAAPVPLLSYAGPVTHDPVALAFTQHIGAADPLRTGAYAKTLTFTLSTTAP